MAVVACQTCHGNGTILKEVKPGVWKEVKCPAGCNDGKVEKRLL
jgi:DnaJ-class molecular chaperone